MTTTSNKESKEHKHEYSKKLIRIRADNPDYTGQSMGIIIATCKCGQDYAADYGDYNSLLAKKGKS